MTLTNQEILARLDAAIKDITDVTALGTSVLQPGKQERFVRAMQARANILAEARYMRMDSQIEDIDRVGFMSRILRAGIDGSGNHRTLAPGQTPAQFSVPTFATERLTAKELQAVASLRDAALRRNIERGNFENTLIDLFGEAAGRDMEEFALLGNSGLAWAVDDVLSLSDNWIKLAANKVYGNYKDKATSGGSTTLSANAAAGDQVVAFTAVTNFAIGDAVRIGGKDATQEFKTITDIATLAVTFDSVLEYDQPSGRVVVELDAVPQFNPLAAQYPDNLFQAALEALPKKYLQSTTEWRFWVDWATEDAYRNRLKQRQTALGDTATTEAQDLKYKGIPVVYAPMLERSKAYDATDKTWGRVGLLGHPDNMVWGVFHEVTIERDRMPKSRQTDFVLTLEGDAGYEDKNAAVGIFIEEPAPA